MFNSQRVNPVIALKEALRLMQLDYVDLYYAHFPLSDMDENGN